jgi:hypothetical protein
MQEDGAFIQKKMKLTGIKNQSAFIRGIALGSIFCVWICRSRERRSASRAVFPAA